MTMKQGLQLFGQWLGGAMMTIVLLFGYQALADGDLSTDGTPKYVPYKGTLERDGVAYQGTIAMKFDLYDEDDSGTVAWTETQTVTVYGGRFSVLLGSTSGASVTALTALLTKADDITLSITLDPQGDNVMLANRQRFLPVPLALWSTASTDFTVGNTLTVETSVPVAADGSAAPVIVRDASNTLAIGTDRINADGPLALNAESGAAVSTGGALDVGGPLDVTGKATTHDNIDIRAWGLEIHYAQQGAGGTALVHGSSNTLVLNPSGDFARTDVRGNLQTEGNNTFGDDSGDTHTFTGPVTSNHHLKALGYVDLGDAASDQIKVVGTMNVQNSATLGSAAGDTLTVNATSTFANGVTFSKDVTGLTATYSLTDCDTPDWTAGVNSGDAVWKWCSSGKFLRGIRVKDNSGDGTDATLITNVECCSLSITVK
jgi:hypothetical protein